MSKVDDRKVSHDVKETIRIEAIHKWLDGAKVQRLSKEYCTNSSCIYRWWSVLKSYHIGRIALKTKDQFLGAVSSGLKSRQRKRKKILWIIQG